MWRARRRTQRFASLADSANCHAPDAEPTGQLLADPRRVLGREHVGDAAAHLALDGGHRRRGPWPAIAPGVAEAEVDVVVAVDAAEMRARRAST